MTQEEVSLEARLEEQESFDPPESFVEQANVSDPEIYAEFEDEWPECWERAADLLSWDSEYDTVLDDDDEPSMSGSRVENSTPPRTVWIATSRRGQRIARRSNGRVNWARRGRTRMASC